MQMDAEKNEFTECDKSLHIQERNENRLTCFCIKISRNI